MAASSKWDSAAACSGEGLAGGRRPGVQTSGEPEYATQASAAAFTSGCSEMLQMWPLAWPVSQTCSTLDGWYVHGFVEFAAACFHVASCLASPTAAACSSELRRLALPAKYATGNIARLHPVGQKEAQLDGHWRGECECICMPAGAIRRPAREGDVRSLWTYFWRATESTGRVCTSRRALAHLAYCMRVCVGLRLR